MKKAELIEKYEKLQREEEENLINYKQFTAKYPTYITEDIYNKTTLNSIQSKIDIFKGIVEDLKQLKESEVK